MPIKPENRRRYPRNWQEIRFSILRRAGYWLYDVQYSNDTGELKRSEFLEDELEEQP